VSFSIQSSEIILKRTKGYCIMAVESREKRDVAVVLGGGAALGLAHIGALKVILPLKG
jgi:hypothetical protein